MFLSAYRPHPIDAFVNGLKGSPSVLSIIVMILVFGAVGKFIYLSQVLGWTYPNIVFSWEPWWPWDALFLGFGIGITGILMLTVACVYAILSLIQLILDACIMKCFGKRLRKRALNDALHSEIQRLQIQEMAQNYYMQMKTANNDAEEILIPMETFDTATSRKAVAQHHPSSKFISSKNKAKTSDTEPIIILDGEETARGIEDDSSSDSTRISGFRF